MALDDGINNFSQSPALVLSRLKASVFFVFAYAIPWKQSCFAGPPMMGHDHLYMYVADIALEIHQWSVRFVVKTCWNPRNET